MDGTQIVETWQVFKEYLDKKHIETVAEKFVDFGTEDEAFRDALGSDGDLDQAIGYYLEEDVDDLEDNYNDVDEDY
jgi:hypothetical protein